MNISLSSFINIRSGCYFVTSMSHYYTRSCYMIVSMKYMSSANYDFNFGLYWEETLCNPNNKCNPIHCNLGMKGLVMVVGIVLHRLDLSKLRPLPLRLEVYSEINDTILLICYWTVSSKLFTYKISQLICATLYNEWHFL